MTSAVATDEYRHELKTCASRQLERPWPSCWPKWTSRNLQICHSGRGALFSAKDAIAQAEVDRLSPTKATCMIENISPEWAVELGVAWNIPVEFFMEYLKAPEAGLSKRTFNEARLPGSSGGLQSTRGGPNWVTLRGVIDFGQRNLSQEEDVSDEDSIRLESYTGPGRMLQHTNVSVFSVHDKFDLFLIDKASDAHKMFMLNQDPAFPRQSMIRLASVDWPGHMCFPQLRRPCDTAVWPVWNLLGDTHTAEGLMYCLQHHGIDDFLYKASVFECQRHLNAALSRVKFISLQDIPNREEQIMGQLRDARQALNRLYRCVEENKSHERALERTNRSATPSDKQCVRTYFHKLADEVRDLEQTVLRDMKVLMMTMSTRDVANSLKLTEATHQQTRSMAILTWLMMFYAPLSFAAGIFGMNLQQLNDSGLHISNFLIVSLSLLGGTACFALSCGFLLPKARAQHCTVAQLLWPSSAITPIKSWWLSAMEAMKKRGKRLYLRKSSAASSSTDDSRLSKLEAGENV